ncbi:MAG: hypothetical protein GKR92_05885 [Gammaproteobacteria bacterium]|nr:MAG: hypothetical protein GKR92_05885 [Gammaproteobacteria bacterium]
MIYVFFILPAIVFFFLLGRQSRKVWDCYEKNHVGLYSKFQVIDNRPKSPWEWFIAQWSHQPPSTYIDPNSGIRKNIFSLSKDLELAKSTNDENLIKLVNTRIKYWQASVISAAFIPLMVVIYWILILTK